MFQLILKSLREEKSLSQYELADIIGVKQSTVAMWESGKNKPSYSTQLKLSEFFNVSIDYLLGRDKKTTNHDSLITSLLASGVLEPIKTKKVPMLGSVSCGEPIMMAAERDLFVNVSSSLNIDFVIKAKGDSMIGARIFDGDLVFVKEASIVDDGKIAVVAIDDEVVLKRFYYDREKNTVILMSENSSYLPKSYKGEEIDQIRVLGQAVAFQSNL